MRDARRVIAADDLQPINMPFQNFMIENKEQLRLFMADKNGGFPETIENG